MEVVKLNRIKAVIAETGKQGKRLAKQLGNDPATLSPHPRTISPIQITFPIILMIISSISRIM